MKKTLLATAVAFALSAPFNVYAGPSDPEFGEQDDAFNSSDDSVTATGSHTVGSLSKSTNSPKDSYNPIKTNSDNVYMTNGYNDTNSDNSVTIGEDGTVVFAQDLDQFLATTDMTNIVGVGDASGANGGVSDTDGNVVVDNSAHSDGALSGPSNKPSAYLTTRENVMSLGAFNHYNGLASTSQNVGHSTSVSQSVVVQSNGGV